MRRHLTVLLFSTFLAGPALAQATQPPADAQPPAKQQQPMQQPAPMGQPAQTGQLNFVQQQQQGEWSSQWLTGSNVYNRQDENLGSINDIILGSDGRAVAVVIGVGGFLGIGEKNVAVAFDALDVQPYQRGGAAGAPTTGQAAQDAPGRPFGGKNANADQHRIYLDATREQLDAAPEYKHADAQRGVLGGAGGAR